MRKTQQRPRVHFDALVSWWRERRRSLPVEMWDAYFLDKQRAMDFVLEVVHLWREHGRASIQECQDQVDELKRKSRSAFVRVRDWRDHLVAILTGMPHPARRAEGLSDLEKLYETDDERIGLAKLIPRLIAPSTQWEFFTDLELALDENAQALSIHIGSEVGGALRRIQEEGVEDLLLFAEAVESALPNAIQRILPIENFLTKEAYRSAQDLQLSLVGLVAASGTIVRDARSTNQRLTASPSHDCIECVLKAFLHQQLRYATARVPRELLEMRESERSSSAHWLQALSVIASVNFRGAAAHSIHDQLATLPGLLCGLDYAMANWAAGIGFSPEEGESSSWQLFVTCYTEGVMALGRLDTIRYASICAFLLETISTTAARISGLVRLQPNSQLPLRATTVDQCTVEVVWDEERVNLSVPGGPRVPASVAPPILRLLKAGIDNDGIIPRPKNPNAATHFRKWFAGQFRVTKGGNADPLAFEREINAYRVRFELRAHEYLDIAQDRRVHRRGVRAALALEAKAKEESLSHSAEEEVTRRLTAPSDEAGLRKALRGQLGHDPSNEELQDYMRLAKDLGLFPDAVTTKAQKR